MILSDRDIKRALDAGLIGIEGEYNIGPASVDLNLSGEVPTTIGVNGALPPGPMFSHWDVINPKVDVAPRMRHLAWGRVPRVTEDGIVWDEGWLLPAHSFALASTSGRVTIEDRHAIRLEGKSSLARLGLAVHITAGFFDPGFRGHPTLELFNFTDFGFLLIPGMPICQVAVEPLSSPSESPYEGKYVDQGAAPQASRYHKNFDK